MTDAIVLTGLRVVATHGVLVEEQHRAQPFEIDLRIEADLSLAAKSDDLADALDYGKLASIAAGVATSRQFALLESLADAIATALLDDARIDAVNVVVRKLRPPVALDMNHAGVSITRYRTPTSA